MTSRRGFIRTGTAFLGAAQIDKSSQSNAPSASVKIGRTLYTNALAAQGDVRDFRLEGDATITFENKRMRMTSVRDPKEGQTANYVYWCPEEFPSDIEVTWEFSPLKDSGLGILFFAATGKKGEHIFDTRLQPRSGPYEQYHHGDVNALHISYFRRSAPDERAFHTCNLRKSYGFHLVAQGADPIPCLAEAQNPYRLRLFKYKGTVDFFINDLLILHWVDDGQKVGPILGGGKIGFRQMAPLIAEYSNLVVRAVVPA